MSCKFDKDIIQKYIDNQIDPLELIFLKEHIKYCEECKKDIELLTLADQGLYNLHMDIALPDSLDVFVEGIVEQCIEENKKRSVAAAILNRGIASSKAAAAQAIRIAGYIPGTKIAARTVKATVSYTASYIGSSSKKYIKNKLKATLSNML